MNLLLELFRKKACKKAKIELIFCIDFLLRVHK